MPVNASQPAQDERETILASNDTELVFEALDRLFDTGKTAKIAEGRRIEFFEGKRKMKDGKTKKTGHHYWQWVYKTDTGGRKRPYGGAIATVPTIYQYRRGEYEARVSSRGFESLANDLL